VSSPLQYGRHLTALLDRMPADVAREYVLRYAQAVLRAQKAGGVSIAFGERTVFNLDVLRFFKGRDPVVAEILGRGMQGGDVRDLAPKEGAFEGFCDDLDGRIEAELPSREPTRP